MNQHLQPLIIDDNGWRREGEAIDGLSDELILWQLLRSGVFGGGCSRGGGGEG